jgi:glycerol-3-phosphate dehydrogenase
LELLAANSSSYPADVCTGGKWTTYRRTPEDALNTADLTKHNFFHMHPTSLHTHAAHPALLTCTCGKWTAYRGMSEDAQTDRPPRYRSSKVTLPPTHTPQSHSLPCLCTQVAIGQPIGAWQKFKDTADVI